MSTASPALVFRTCAGIGEMTACVALQKEVWGFADADLVPLRMFVVAEKVGGQIIGCFDGAALVGFALSIPGTRDGRLYLHSHMLAVRASHRDMGIGRRLKLAQRDDALARGIRLIEWTFDPLEIKNAYLNISRLGAISRRYTLNQYGNSSSPLQGGLPTDRLVAEWWLGSRHVRAVLDGGKPAIAAPAGRITVPRQIYDWKKDPAMQAKAAEVQSQNRAHFLEAFSQGLSVAAFELSTAGDGTFLLQDLAAETDLDWSIA